MYEDAHIKRTYEYAKERQKNCLSLSFWTGNRTWEIMANWWGDLANRCSKEK